MEPIVEWWETRLSESQGMEFWRWQEKSMSKVAVIAGFLILAAVATPAAWAASSVAQQRADIRNMAQSTLQHLYGLQPAARAAIRRAAGYAVFSNFGMKILFAGGGKGQGLAVNNTTRQQTFMKMLEVQAGLGFGVKKFNVVFVLDNAQAFDHFVSSGWLFGGQTTAAAKYKTGGQAIAGAVAVAPGVWVYQLTESGLALELTLKGTKYYKDSELN
jgi:lipid-binding SYLF domain-containing protein